MTGRGTSDREVSDRGTSESTRVVTLTAGRAAHLTSLQFGFSSHRGHNPSRPVNEDAGGWAELRFEADHHQEDTVMVLVADGVGGMAGGAQASAAAAEFLLKSDPPQAGLSAADFSTWLIDRVFAADGVVRASAPRGERTRHGRSTLTAVALRGERFVVAHVGDSRAYLAAPGRLVRLTNDHTLLGSLVAEGHLSEAEAASRPGRNPLLRALGSLEDPDNAIPAVIDGLQSSQMFAGIAEDRLLPTESLVLLTDGVWSVVPAAEIESVVDAAQTAQEIADGLIERALAAGGPDNATAAVVTRLMRGRDTRELRVWGTGEAGGGVPVATQELPTTSQPIPTAATVRMPHG